MLQLRTIRMQRNRPIKTIESCSISIIIYTMKCGQCLAFKSYIFCGAVNIYRGEAFVWGGKKNSPIQHVTRGTWLDLTWGRSQNAASCRQLPGYWLVHYLSQLKSTFAKEMSREWSEKYLRIVCETRISEKCKLISGSNGGGNCFVLFSINLEVWR